MQFDLIDHLFVGLKASTEASDAITAMISALMGRPTLDTGIADAEGVRNAIETVREGALALAATAADLLDN